MRDAVQHRFAERFAKHRATLEVLSSGVRRIERLVWAEPGTGIHLITYLLDGPRLIVTGDCFSAVYVSGVRSLASWAACDLHYFASKCEASPHGRGFESFDRETALAGARDMLAECTPEQRELWDEYRGEDAAHDGAGGWDAWLREHAYDVFGDDWWDSHSLTGRRVDPLCEMHLVGLNLAVAQLHAETERLDFDALTSRDDADALGRELIGGES